MQTIYLDISNKGVIPTIHAKQGDVGRKFKVVLTDSGLPYIPVGGSAFSVWYSGASGEGNYTEVGDKSAFSVSGNKVTVEMISQMLSNDGEGILSLVLNDPNGNQISTWNIHYVCEYVPGAGSQEAKAYYTAFSQAVENLPYPDASLSVSGKAADAAATGKALEDKAPAGIVSKTIKIASETELDNALTEEINTMTNDSARFLVFSPTSSSVFGGIATLCRLYKRSDSGYGTADFIGYATHGPNTWQKSWYGGTWKPIEWVNPPMVLGVEYRTTERWNGKVVYTKLVNVGALPNNSSKNTESLLPYNITAISVLGVGVNEKKTAPIPSRHTYVSVDGEWGTLYVAVDSDYSAYTGYITVKYTKD